MSPILRRWLRASTAATLVAASDALDKAVALPPSPASLPLPRSCMLRVAGCCGFPVAESRLNCADSRRAEGSTEGLSIGPPVAETDPLRATMTDTQVQLSINTLLTRWLSYVLLVRVDDFFSTRSLLRCLQMLRLRCDSPLPTLYTRVRSGLDGFCTRVVFTWYSFILPGEGGY